MKKLAFISLFSLMLLFILISIRQNYTPSENVYSMSELKNILAAKEKLEWKNEKDAKLIYSAIYYTGNEVAIGLRPKNTKYQSIGGIRNLDAPELQNAYHNVLNTILGEEQAKKEDILVKDMKHVPNIIVRINRFETIEALLKLSEIRYIEPLGDMTSIWLDAQTTPLEKIAMFKNIFFSQKR
ncbi:MAG: hypothetical protein ACPG5B_00520 [Chitinophagales bacterium]